MSYAGTGTAAEGTARPKSWNGPERAGQAEGFSGKVAESGKLSLRSQGNRLFKGSWTQEYTVFILSIPIE